MAGVKGRSGGFRPGSGAKRRAGLQRDENGRVVGTCACGRLMSRQSSRCRACYCESQRGTRRVPPKPCVHCGAPIVDVTRGRRTCSDACRAIRFQEHVVRMRLSESEKAVQRRLRRRKASAQRRAHGWKSGHRGRWIDICERDGWACWICNGVIDSALVPPHRLSGSVDHVVPLSAGGGDGDNNCKAAHLTCNIRRFRTAAPLGVPTMMEA